jgi:hypothetical protein
MIIHTERIEIRVTEPQLVQFKKAAKDRELPLSMFIRLAALRAAKDEEYLNYQMRGKKLHRVFPEDEKVD